MKSNAFLRISTLLLGALLCIGLLTATVNEEVPLGSLRGTVTMKENGKPLKQAWVTLIYLGGANDEARTYRHYEGDNDGQFTANHIPAGVYTIDVSTRAHEMKRQAIVIEEGKTLDLNLELKPKQPEMQIYASQRVFTPGQQPSFQIMGFDPAPSAKVTYYKLDLDKIVAKGSLRSLLYSFSRPDTPNGTNPAASAVSSDSFEKKLLSKDAEGVFTEYIDLPTVDRGFYYVTCQVGNQLRATYLNVSTIALVTKTADKSALCYVTDLTKGSPIGGASVLVPGHGGLKEVAKTSASGTATVTTSPSNNQALVVASYQGSQAVVDFYTGDYSADESRMFMYTDRPIYRPGDTVQFKGIVRRLQGQSYSVPTGGQVQLELHDPEGTVIRKMTAPLSDHGSFDGTFASNVEDTPGVYSLQANYAGNRYTQYINLAAYRKPEFSISVSPTKDFFVYGNRAAVKLKAEYYFGGPVIGAQIQAFVSRSPHYSYMDDYGDDEEYDYSDGRSSVLGEFSQQLEVTTNEKGEAVIEFDTRTEGDPEVADADMDYTVYVSMTDESGRYFDATGTALVVRGDISAELSTDDYIAEPGTTVNATVTVKTQAGDKPVAGKPVSLVVGTEKWEGKEAVFHPQRTLTGTTDQRGVAIIPVQVSDEGSLVLKSTVNDSQGRPVVSESYLYVEGATIFGPPSAQFTLTLDKKTYRPDDKCKVLIETDKPGSSALVTVQAEKVLATYVVLLDKPATMFTIPIKQSYSPNVWVSAVAVKDKQLLQAESRLVVNVQDHDLKIAVTPDRESYQPGQVANLTIKTTDANGKPVPADVSLGVVDESIYAIRSDSTDIKKAFYPMRPNYVGTSYSFEEIYLDGGDKGGGDIPVRSKFLDTAAWLPMVRTDINGVAHKSITLPDNLTSWRATVVGVTDATQVGMSHVNFRANKPLTVRLALPSFLVQQDTQEITATITNDTGRDQDVSLRLDAQGVKVDGDLSQKVHVTAARPKSVTWTVRTPQAGQARLTAYAWTDTGDQDAEERSVEIQPHGRKVMEAHAGELKDGVSATFTVSQNAARSTGGLDITIEPSVGATIYQSLDELIDFPYGCTEQTMSRFLPAVVLSSVLKDQNIRTDLEAKVPQIVDSGFARLAKMQHMDGSWGWWEYDAGDDFMTAYVLDGLKRAAKAGYTTNKINVKQALSWAKERLAQPLDQYEAPRDRIYLAYAASLYGVEDAPGKALESLQPKSASGWALAALAYNQMGNAAARGNALAHLNEMAVEEGDMVYFDRSEYEYGIESSAFPLMALTTLMPDNPFIPKIVRRMVVTRRGYGWYSTRDTSLALIGLTQYMRLSPSLGEPVEVDLSINGGAWQTLKFDPASVVGKGATVKIPMADLRQGVNRVDFELKGQPGSCYYSASLTQVELADTLRPLRPIQGLSIIRNYYLLEPQRLPSGQMELRPSKQSIEEAKPGDLIRVDLMISTAKDREFMMIEDPIPSGCRITEREYISDSEQWSYWWSQTVVRDDHAAFFVRYMPSGMQTLSYTMRVEQVGLSHALPPTVSNMYDPDQIASGGETVLKVTE